MREKKHVSQPRRPGPPGLCPGGPGLSSIFAIATCHELVHPNEGIPQALVRTEPRRQPTAALGPLLNSGGKPQPPVMSDRAAAEARCTCPAATGPAPPHRSASAATLATPDYSARHAGNPEQSGHIKIPTIPHNPGCIASPGNRVLR